MAIYIKIYIDSSFSRKEGRKMLVVFASSSSKYRTREHARERRTRAKDPLSFLTCTKSAEMNGGGEDLTREGKK